MKKNNHESMKTVVETFLTEETIDLIYDNEQLEKWNKHVKELGLTGQTSIAKKDKSPIPFMHLKTSYKNICEQLCPRKVNIEDYNVTPIPVEILDLVGLSKKEEYFKKIQIWYDEKSPDPFCVGVNPEGYYSLDNGGSWKTRFDTKQQAQNHQNENGWTQHSPKEFGDIYYLLGKWADVKHSWKELKQMAIDRFKAEKSNDYLKAIKEAKRGLEDVETEAFDRFN